MRTFLFLALILAGRYLAAQETEQAFTDLRLSDLSDFRPQAGNWSLVADVEMDPFPAPAPSPASEPPPASRKRRKNSGPEAAPAPASAPVPPIRVKEGAGILINRPVPGKKDNLYTQWEHGDIELELEVMLPPGSNSGIYLQGGYELQLFDSWGVDRPRYSDMAGIYRNYDTGATRFPGKPPLVNAARAPGLWQQLRILFRAPRFDATGAKTENARFVAVDLNGVRIHEQVEVAGLTAGSFLRQESARGPLMIQGDHGTVAFRRIRYRLNPEFPRDGPQQNPRRVVSPIMVRIGHEPRLLRAFLDFAGDRARRLTHTLAVGDPSGLHYIYNLKAGNLACVWRGEFLDATPMWHSRGDGSYRPAGMAQYLTMAPAIAYLSNSDAPFPDSADAETYRPHGYSLQPGLRFHFQYRDLHVVDSIAAAPAERGIARFIRLADSVASTANMYFRVADGLDIRAYPATGLYAVDGQYFIRMDSGQELLLRRHGGGSELLLKMDGQPVRYSIIW